MSIGSIISGIAGIAGPLLSGMGGQEQASAQSGLNDQIIQLLMAGVTDPFGNSVTYDPEKGFVTNLSPYGEYFVDQAQEQGIADTQQGRYLSDLDYRSKLGADIGSTEFLRRALTQYAPNPSDLLAISKNENAARVNPAIDRLINQLALQGMRTGSDPSEAINEANVQRMLGLTSGTPSYVDSLNQSQKLNTNNASSNTDIAAALRGLATGGPSNPIGGFSIPNASGRAGNAKTMAAGLAGIQAPNPYGNLGNTVTAVGSGIENLIRQLGNQG